MCGIIHAVDKVLNINWSGSNNIEVVSFRRGDWENFLVDQSKKDITNTDVPKLWFDNRDWRS